MPLLIQLLIAYHILAVFVGAFFFGESVIITAAYVTAQLEWAPAYVVLAAFLGTVASDSIWFFVGRAMQKRAARMQRFQKQRQKAAELLHALTGTRPFVTLLFIKFLYGSRIAMISYLAARKVSFSTFTLFNAIGTTIWLGVIFPIGYLAGKGMSRALPAFESIEIAVVVFVVSAIIFRLFSLWLTKRITKDG